MKNKDWKTELRRSWGHLYLLNEDNEFCKIINEIDDLEDFISKEIEKARKEGYAEGASNAVVTDIQEAIDKAREEGYQNCMDDIWEKAKELRSWAEHDGNISATDIEAGLEEAYLNIESKLKK